MRMDLSLSSRMARPLMPCTACELITKATGPNFKICGEGIETGKKTVLTQRYPA